LLTSIDEYRQVSASLDEQLETTRSIGGSRNEQEAELVIWINQHLNGY
jgi:hypothetical protein